MVGLGLVMFGAEGSRTTAFSDATFNLGSVSISGQSLWVVGTAVVLIVALYLYFDRTISGKALRATSVNRLGARLVGIGTTQAGRLAFTLAAGLGALCGVLVAPITTIYYDSGFLIGLKGFVGAIVGGLVSYPLRRGGFAAGRAAGIVFVVLGERLQRGDRVHADHSGAAVAESGEPAFR